MPTRAFSGCVLDVAGQPGQPGQPGGPVEITLTKDRQYFTRLTEEQIMAIRTSDGAEIFFDPTLILDIADMDPVNINFGGHGTLAQPFYVDLWWDFGKADADGVVRRHHIVSLRICERSEEAKQIDLLKSKIEDLGQEIENVRTVVAEEESPPRCAIM
jgi:hypothetical protein